MNINGIAPKNTELAKFRKQVRQAIADYMRSEGCSCCQNIKAHEEHTNILGKLLKVKKYDDGSGYNFSKYRSEPLSKIYNHQVTMKTETKVEHTAGPWEISYSRDGKEALINYGLIARVELDDNQDGEANAKLISAAPEMLKLIEEAEAWLSFNTTPSKEEISDFKKSLQAAIKKARV